MGQRKQVELSDGCFGGIKRIRRGNKKILHPGTAGDPRGWK